MVLSLVWRPGETVISLVPGKKDAGLEEIHPAAHFATNFILNPLKHTITGFGGKVPWGDLPPQKKCKVCKESFEEECVSPRCIICKECCHRKCLSQKLCKDGCIKKLDRILVDKSILMQDALSRKSRFQETFSREILHSFKKMETGEERCRKERELKKLPKETTKKELQRGCCQK